MRTAHPEPGSTFRRGMLNATERHRPHRMAHSHKGDGVKKIYVATLAAGLLLAFASGCRNKNDTEQMAGQSPQKKEFVAPADSAISLEQIRNWKNCNPLLDSLTYMYEDSFKVDDDGVRLRYQNDFVKAQDAICVRMGLSGGYDEYLFIRKVMGLPRNRALLDSVGMALY